MSNCGCPNDAPVLVDETPWLRVSADLLRMFQRPILCRLRYQVFDDVLTFEKLSEMSVLLDEYIAAKTADPNTELYFDRFAEIQQLIDNIYQKGTCL
jgi:hypothetical protein